MVSSIPVFIGEMAVTNDKDTVLTSFVGSCIALCLFDSQAGVAGMAHVMIPEYSSNKVWAEPDLPGKYSDLAVEALMKMMITKGAAARRITAKLAGGANMFAHESGIAVFKIGERNAEILKNHLKKNHVPLTSEDVGSTIGRRVEFYVKSGTVIVKSRKQGERKL